MSKNIAIIGSSGAIGNAFVEHYLKDNAVEKIFSFSRSVNSHTSKKIYSFDIDIESQESIEKAASYLEGCYLDRVIIASGVLHTESFGPEKSIKDLNYETLSKVYSVNTIGPALVGKYFLPLLNKETAILLYGNLSKNDEELFRALAISPLLFLELVSLMLPFALSLGLPFGFSLAE